MTKLAETAKKYFLWTCATAVRLYFQFHGMPTPEIINVWFEK